ncbi:glycosyltransferase family 4 protein [Curtobacterium sp. HSID17257]|uniref:glycosyltransferase family 4 protein n=1 Tax=Curtobacterium sp. HSID17257 TaxID=2419510 RepID=UPI001EE7DF41|nr:glycosyltransferase family 4 protein [Curtobacterium sp. HSID17257]
MVDTAAARRPLVLHVNHSVEFGGAELALARLLQANEEWRAVLLLPRQRRASKRIAEPFDSLEGGNTTVLRYGPPPKSGASSNGGSLRVIGFGISLLRLSLSVTRSVWSMKPQVVWANSSRAAVYAALAPRPRRTSFILHLRDRVEKDALGRLGYLAMTRVALRRADGVVANSDSTLASARRFLKPSTRAIVLQSPAGLVRVTPEQLAARQQTRDPTVVRIGMVARLDPWKGQHLVLRALALASDRGLVPSVVLHVAGAAEFGHESYRQELADLVTELDLDDKVVFEGRVDDVNSFIDRMDICVQYSTRPEPLGQNVLQYLARGSAVIAANEGGPAEWIKDGENGRLVRPTSLADLADAIADLVEDDKERLRLGLNASRTAGLRTDSEIVAEAAEYLTSETRKQTRVGGALKVRMTGSEWFASRPGGLNRYFIELYSAMRELEGVEVDAVAFGEAPLGGRSWGPTRLPLLRRLFKSFARTDDIDVVDRHFCLYGVYPKPPRRTRRPLSVVHFHGPWAAESAAAGGSSFANWVKRAIERRRYRSADLVVVLSRAFEEVVIHNYGVRPERVRVISPGVRIPSERARTVDASREFVGPIVLCVRRLERRMGIDTLIQAWGRVLAAHPSARLRIVGDGSERCALEKLAGPLGKSVTFLGRVSDELLEAEYAQCALTVVPSRSLEGFGLIALESLAHGKAPIVTDCGGLPDSVRDLDPSLIVARESEEGLSARIIEGLNGVLPDEVQCRAHAERFSWAICARKHIETYGEYRG